MRRSVRLLALSAACLVVAGAAVGAAAQAWPSWIKKNDRPEPDYPEVTVSADWLAARLGASGTVVLDARPRDEYLSGHIPGAVSFPPEERPDLEKLSELERLPALLGALGLTGRERLVCCGRVSYSADAAELFWLLEVAGAERVALLEGGVSGWRAAGRELARETTVRERRRWKPDAVPSLVASREYVRRSFGEPGVEIIDARGAEAWRGPVDREEWGTLKRVGHIPHALPFDFTAFADADGSLMSPSHTWKAFARLGPRAANPVDLDDEFVVYGWGRGGGRVAAGRTDGAAEGSPAAAREPDEGAMAYFLLRRAGIRSVRYYPGGWSDWSDDPYLPVVRIITAEELMHNLEAARRWLRPSASPETFVLLDVRHPADYEREHLRGAANLRSDYFADSLDVVLERSWPDIDRASTPIVTYCYGEYCIRSRATSTAAARAGFVYVERFFGGLDEWRSAGGKLVSGE